MIGGVSSPSKIFQNFYKNFVKKLSTQYNQLMPEMSRRFNFDDFDQLCADALDDRREKTVEEYRVDDALLCAEGLTFAATQRSQELFGDDLLEEVPLTMLGEHPVLFPETPNET